MKKICILSAVNIKHMSMISLYTELLERDGIDYDIVYMDKYGEEENIGAKNKYVYYNPIDPNLPKWKKVLQYWKFRKYAIKTIENNKYDFIIVWNDVAIFMFADYLAKKWKGRYCLNIRDYCRQDNILFKARFKKVIDNAAYNTTSSPGYKIFLPKAEYIHVHSLNTSVLKELSPRDSLCSTHRPIKIGFVGYVRFYELQKKLLDLFKNDSRFELHFYGSHSEELAEYAKTNNITNTSFYGSFPVSDTVKYLQKIDIINNIYGNNTKSLDYALSIKLYHGVYSRLPILVCPNTYMEEICDIYKIGFTIDEYTNEMKDRLYHWYRSIDFTTFNNSCDKFISKIEKDKELFLVKYEQYIKEN